VATRSRPPSAKLFDVLAPGLYAWGVTVAWPVSHRFAPLGSRILALVAVVALVSGGALMFLTPTLSRIFGIWIFVASCVGSWAFIAPALAPTQLDSVQGVLGAFGWALFAISWGSDTPTPTATATATATTTTQPALPKTTPLLLTLVALAAATPMLLAWSVQTLERALLAHAVSLAVAIALVAFAVDLFEPRSAAEQAGFAGFHSPERRLSSALPTLALLAMLAIAGAAYALLR
jgi:hypothetical protein